MRTLADGCRAGFTLTELLIVMAGLGVLAGLLLSVLTGAERTATQTACASNLRQIGVALTMYVDATEHFPACANMPSLGLSELPPPSDALSAQLEGAVEVFACPADSTYYATERSSYEWNIMLNGREPNGVSFFGHVVEPKDLRVLWDFEDFHGEDDQPGARNILFFDNNVRAF